MTLRTRLARRLRRTADRIDNDNAFRRMTILSVALEPGHGWVLRQDGTGVPVWYRTPDYSRADEVPLALCGAQDWAYDDDDRPFIYGTCELPSGHAGGWHQQLAPSGGVWAEWRGPHDARAPEGARDGIHGGGPQ